MKLHSPHHKPPDSPIWGNMQGVLTDSFLEAANPAVLLSNGCTPCCGQETSWACPFRSYGRFWPALLQELVVRALLKVPDTASKIVGP